MTATDVTTQVRLQWYHRNQLTAEWRFTEPFCIGSDAACEVRIDDPMVAPRHVEVYTAGSVWRVRDLSAQHRTFVNGAPARDERLGSPSMIQLGWNGPLFQLTLEAANGDGMNGCVAAPPPTVRPDRIPARNGHASKIPPVPAPAMPPPSGTPRYRGHGFTLPLPEGWQDRTLYTLAGPVLGGVRHSIVVEVDPAPGFDTAAAYVDNQVRLLSVELDGFRLLKRDEKRLADGTPAERLLFRWKLHGRPPLYQEQLFILQDGAVYKLTASFTNVTRKKLGAEIEALMLSFQPG